MKLERLSLIILCLTMYLSSCKKDDNGDDGITVIEVKDRTEQQAIDIALIEDYLEKHYYNSDDFTGNADASLSDLVITKLADGETEAPTGHTKLIDAVGNPKTTNFLDIDYEYYVLSLNVGGGFDSPTFADEVLVGYEGFTLENEVFDSAINPVEFDLVSLIPAWKKVLPEFNTAENFVENGDGTVSFLNRGIGVMFIPSGLAYFSSATAGISAYSSI